MNGETFRRLHILSTALSYHHDLFMRTLREMLRGDLEDDDVLSKLNEIYRVSTETASLAHNIIGKVAEHRKVIPITSAPSLRRKSE